MKRILTTLAILIAVLTGAQAQNATRVIPLQNGAPVSASNPFYIQGSLSATLSGFAPGASYASLTATGSSARTALTTGLTAVVFNTGTTSVSCALGNSSVTAVANENIIQPNSWLGFTIGNNVDIACIDQGAADTTSNVVVISGGSGLPTGAGGGGGGGGGGTSSTFGSAFPATGTAIGVSNGTNMVALTLGQAAASASLPVILPSATITTLTPPSNTGYSTAANQATEYGYLATIASAVVLPIPTQAPTVSIGGVGIIDSAGTNVATVKAASTPATATDKSLVVQINAAEQPAIPLNQTQQAGATVVAEPCQTNAKTFKPISLNGTSGTYTTPLVTGTSAVKTYICQFVINNTGSAEIAIVEATTATSCGTVTAGVFGGTTAGTGFNFAANGGVSIGSGGYSIAKTATNNDDICVITNSTTQISGGILYVQQ